MYIDCDTHYFPVKFLEGISDQYPDSPRVVRKGDEVKSVLPDGTLIKNQAPKGRWDLDVRVQQADFEGFDKHVLIPENRELLYTWDRDLGCELARRYNDAVAQDLAECAHPERYIGVGWVFLPDAEESCKELDRMVNQLGIKAVKFMGGFEDANLGAERLWPVYDKVCQLDIPILVHDTASDRQDHPNPALVGIEQLYLEADNNALPFLLAFPFRYIVDMGSLILRGALKEFPDLRICFVEGSAAFVPWLMNRLDMDPNGRKKLGKDPSEFSARSGCRPSPRRLPSATPATSGRTTTSRWAATTRTTILPAPGRKARSGWSASSKASPTTTRKRSWAATPCGCSVCSRENSRDKANGDERTGHPAAHGFAVCPAVYPEYPVVV